MTEAKRVQVGSLDVAYAEAGSGEPPLVLVHGFTGSRDDFADLLPALGRLQRTLTPDNRGHGGTTNPGEGYTLEQLRDDLLGFLDALDIARCDLLGHSLGGMVALRLALEAPARLRSLILMDTAPGPIGTMPRPILEAGARIAREHGMAALAAGMRASPPFARSAAAKRAAEEMGEERYWSRIEAKLLAMDPEAFAQLSVVLADQDPVTARLGEISCPTLVVVGEEDHPFLEPSRTLAEAIPDAELRVIRGAAHSPQMENPTAWLEALRHHLARRG